MRDQICNTGFKPSSPVHCKQCTSSYTRYSTIDAIYLVQQLINIVIILLCSITEIITASPPGLRKSALLATNHSRQWYINATWSPDISQYGPNLFCYSATDSAGWVGRICSTMISITYLISLNILFSTQFLFHWFLWFLHRIHCMRYFDIDTLSLHSSGKFAGAWPSV